MCSYQQTIPTVITSENAKYLRAALGSVATDRQKRTLLLKIEQNILSIEHKLNIMRYQNGLIQELDPSAFQCFRLQDTLREKRKEPHDCEESKVGFLNRCSFTMTNTDEYRLFFSLFLDTFAAASFSILDLVGQLLKNLYDLQMEDHQVSYKAVLKKDRIKQHSDLYEFLARYLTTETHKVDWIEPLQKIRNIMTHRTITDICQLSSPMYQGTDEFLIKEEFSTPDSRRELKKFVERCYSEYEKFVEELFNQLKLQVETYQRLPLP